MQQSRPPQDTAASHAPARSAASAVETPQASGLQQFTERYWVDWAGSLRRISILLAAAWQDGLYLTRWPRAALGAPVAAVAVGVIEGATHWTIPTEAAPVGVPVVSYVQMLPFLILVCVAGALSANLGLVLAVGYTLGDFFIAGPKATPSSISDNPFVVFVSLRWPMLIGYALLFALAVIPTLTSEYLLTGLRRALQGRGRETVVLRVVIMAASQAVLVYAWSLMAPVVIRVLWSAVGSIPLDQGISSIIVPGGWLAAAAGIATLLRGWLMLQAYTDPQVARRAARQAAALRAADQRPAITRRLPPLVRLALTAGAFTFFLAGLAANVLEGLLIFLYCGALVFVRSMLPNQPGPWALWARQITRIPLVLRLVVAMALTYWLAQAILSVTLPQLFTGDTGSFQPVLLSVCASLLIVAVLLPARPAAEPTASRQAQASRLL